jgi:hypothetical protein
MKMVGVQLTEKWGVDERKPLGGLLSMTDLKVQ